MILYKNVCTNIEIITSKASNREGKPRLRQKSWRWHVAVGFCGWCWKAVCSLCSLLLLEASAIDHDFEAYLWLSRRRSAWRVPEMHIPEQSNTGRKHDCRKICNNRAYKSTAISSVSISVIGKKDSSAKIEHWHPSQGTITKKCCSV